jgi:hypothetical protein
MAGLAHFGLGFAAKRIAPQVPLAFLLIACGALDFLCLGLILLGLDPNAYLTHSLVMALVWSVIAAGITALISRNFRATLVIGLLVFSHWVVDAITWPMAAVAPDYNAVGMPIVFQDAPRIGLGLYRTVFGVILGEGVFLLAGVALYVTWLITFKKEKKAKAAGERPSTP